MATETSRRGLARETGRGLRFAESAMATPRRAPDFFQQLSWQELQCRWSQTGESRLRGLARRIGMAGYRAGHVDCWFIHAADTRSRASSSANATKTPALPSPTPAVHCAPSWAPSPPLTAWTPSSTPPKPCPSAFSRRARLRPSCARMELTGLASELSRE